MEACCRAVGLSHLCPLCTHFWIRGFSSLLLPLTWSHISLGHMEQVSSSGFLPLPPWPLSPQLTSTPGDRPLSWQPHCVWLSSKIRCFFSRSLVIRNNPWVVLPRLLSPVKINANGHSYCVTDAQCRASLHRMGRRNTAQTVFLQTSGKSNILPLE